MYDGIYLHIFEQIDLHYGQFLFSFKADRVETRDVFFFRNYFYLKVIFQHIICPFCPERTP